MYKITQLLFNADEDRYYCEVSIQDGVERFYLDSLERAKKAVIDAAKALNNDNITEKDIEVIQRWSPSSKSPLVSGGFVVSKSDFDLLQEIKSGAKVVTSVDLRVKQVIVMRNDLNMRKGKMVAQGAHASMSFLTRKLQQGGVPEFNPIVKSWIEGSFAKVCLQAGSEQELVQIHQDALDAGLESHLITDSGKTEFHGVPTKTCLAIGPDLADKIDAITGKLKLF